MTCIDGGMSDTNDTGMSVAQAKCNKTDPIEEVIVLNSSRYSNGRRDMSIDEAKRNKTGPIGEVIVLNSSQTQKEEETGQ